jgi:hypothetical protein
MRNLSKTYVSTIVVFLVTAYLSTWSASLIHSLLLPALGSGPASISASNGPTKERPQITFAQRRHTPPVKSVSPEAPPPTPLAFSRILEWTAGIAPRPGVTLPLDPLVLTHPGRAPPTC